MPLHLRWELHPTPKEEITDGGDFDKTPEGKVLLAELRYAAREGLLFQKCFKSNRGLWYFTYPFHLGLFLSIVWFVLLPVKAAFLAGNALWPVRFLNPVIIACGAGGLVLGLTGCACLMVKRIFDPNLNAYTSLRDYLNLGVILFALAFGFAAWIGSDPEFALSGEYVRSLADSLARTCSRAAFFTRERFSFRLSLLSCRSAAFVTALQSFSRIIGCYGTTSVT